LNAHLIVVSDQAISIPLNMRNSLLGRLALHLSDSAEYFDVVGRVRGTLPDAKPGRGLVRESSSSPVMEFQASLPIGEEETISDSITLLSEEYLAENLKEMSQQLSHVWDGDTPESIEILPSDVKAAEYMSDQADVPDTDGGKSLLPRLTIGLGDRDLDWMRVNYNLHGPHFLVFGPPQSGKTNLLYTWVWDLCERYTEQDVQFTLIGLKGQSLNDLASLPHVQSVVDNEFRLDSVLNDLADMARDRTEKLRELVESAEYENLSVLGERLGPVHFVVVDDFDSIRFTRERQSLLMQFARHGRDTRTFLVIAGASSDLLEFSDLLKLLKRSRYALMLQPGDMEVRVLDVRLPSSASRQEYPVGRGYLLLGNKHELVQTLHLDDQFLEKRLAAFESHVEDRSVA
jgi:hypothetical protein